MSGANIDNDDITLIRGETLSIDVYLTFDSGEPCLHSQIPLDKIRAQARFQNGERIDLDVTELEEESCWNLFSPIDTSKLKGDHFVVNVAVENITDLADKNLTLASVNQTFYIINSATEKPVDIYTVRFLDYDNTVISEQRVRKYDNLVIPASPSREGYDFNGWTPDVELMVKKDMDYIATYQNQEQIEIIETVARHSVVYVVDGSFYQCQDYVEGAAITPAANPPAIEGYEFSGWSSIPATMPDHCVFVTGKFIPVIPEYTQGMIFVDEFGNTEFSSEATFCILIGIGNTSEPKIIIPSEVNGLPVREIGARYAMPDMGWITVLNKNLGSGNDTVTEVYIPDSVNRINYGAFTQSKRLEKVRMPNNPIYICDCAFLRCYALEEILIPQGSTFENSSFDIFEGCHHLRKIFLPKSVNDMGGNIFEDGIEGYAEIYYEGSEDDWAAIRFHGTDYITGYNTIHYNSTIAQYEAA